ncbi:MAG: phosphoribosylanthranilate isomerase [Alphaproteobacteria bacterium]
MVRVKICCIASVEEAALAVRHGAAALGLVGRMPSGPGVIDDPLIAEIAAAAPPAVATFLLTSETEPEAIVDHVRRCGTNTVQIVDAVEPAAYRALRRAVPAVKIVQVIHVTGPEALTEAKALAPSVDALLLDSGRPQARKRELGGTGRVHDWSLSQRIVAEVPRPVFLAGGIRPENAAKAFRQVRPYGIDLCTGVRRDGRLDAERLGDLFAALAAPPAP